MYWLRIYELVEIDEGHPDAEILVRPAVGPGFLNAVNSYYGHRIWR